MLSPPDLRATSSSICYCPRGLSASRSFNSMCLSLFSLLGMLVKFLGNLCPLPPHPIFSHLETSWDNKTCAVSRPFLLHFRTGRGVGRRLFLDGLKAAENLGLWMVDVGRTRPRGKPSTPSTPSPFETPLTAPQLGTTPN